MGVIWMGRSDKPIARMPGTTRPLIRYDFSEPSPEAVKTKEKACSALWKEAISATRGLCIAHGEHPWACPENLTIKGGS